MTKSNTGWIVAMLCAILCIVGVMGLMTMGAPPRAAADWEENDIEEFSDGSELQQDTAVDAVASAKPYFWEIMAFVSILWCSRITQWLKQRRWFPNCMCTWRSSKDLKYRYKQLKKKYLMAFFHVSSYVFVLYCLKQRYDNLEQIAVVTLIINGMLFVVIEGGLKLIEQKNPEFAKVISTGLYKPEDDQTKMTKVATLLLGGGKDRRENRKA